VKLILDEMLSASIAEQLRIRGYDVVAVAERVELRGLPDGALFELAQTEQRSVVTYDSGFLGLDRQSRGRGRNHHGIVVLHPRRFPQRPSPIGELVTALDRLLADGAPYPGFVLWLQ
jgi:hypothetical protein